MAPMKVMTPHKDQIISERPAEPDDWRTPLGLMKMPVPTIILIIIPTLSNNPNRRSNWPVIAGSFSAAVATSPLVADTMLMTIKLL